MKQSDKMSYKQIEKQSVPIDGDFKQGSRIFMKNCSSCHGLSANSKGLKGAGPALGVVYGKKVGSDTYFPYYSHSMATSQYMWNKQVFYAFLEDPQKVFENTKCTFNNNKYLKDPNQRADLIKFFKDYTKQLEINIRIKNERAFGSLKVFNQQLSDIQSGVKQ